MISLQRAGGRGEAAITQGGWHKGRVRENTGPHLSRRESSTGASGSICDALTAVFLTAFGFAVCGRFAGVRSKLAVAVGQPTKRSHRSAASHRASTSISPSVALCFFSPSSSEDSSSSSSSPLPCVPVVNLGV